MEGEFKLNHERYSHEELLSPEEFNKRLSKMSDKFLFQVMKVQ